ncbi:hypothetical protein [Pararhodospirillum oryzae]|uniref:Uncharacterized protein n=1 Tax=Pararhodospirillum oryzae TaxID=478448 RepID=A0A512HBJ3_9PROT|nr:hypothetical protein [Pararhodospirillum oryzae]GEO82805.1 hypothetical protein ROR02_29360 [Pararhodospirillum oryzae]
MSAPSSPWLTRPETIRRLWIVGLATLAVTVLVEPFVEHHPAFAFEGWFAFPAWFGFLACVVLIAVSKVMGLFLKRKDTYYDD